jgi:predicted component of type VI protein secretion system
MADQSYQLVVRKGPRPGQVFPLTLETVTIGRDPMTDIVINDPEVSRHHAKLTRRGGSYEIQDMGSTNGTFVDGKRLAGESVLLSAGQAVMVGSNVTMTFQSTSASDPMATMIAPGAGLVAPKPVAEAEPPAPAIPAPEPIRPEPIYEAETSDEPMELDVDSPATTAMPEIPAPFPSTPAEPEPLPAFDIAPEPLPSFEPEPLPSYGDPGPVRVYDEPESLPTFGQSSSKPIDSGMEPLPAYDSGASTPPPPPAKSGGLGGQNRNVIIAVVAVLVLCCCCALIIGGLYSSGALDDLIGGLLLPQVAAILNQLT